MPSQPALSPKDHLVSGCSSWKHCSMVGTKPHERAAAVVARGQAAAYRIRTESYFSTFGFMPSAALNRSLRKIIKVRGRIPQ